MAKPSQIRPTAHVPAERARLLLREIGSAMQEGRVPARELRLLGELVEREFGARGQTTAGTSSGTAAAAVAVAGDDGPDSPADEEAAGDPPGSAADGPRSSANDRPARGEAHLWVPRGLGTAGLVLALVLDGDRWPDAPTETARRLGCSPDTVTRRTDELLRARLVERSDGYLVATAAGSERLRRCDPLPRRLLRPGVAGRTPKVLRAAAVLYGETIGPRATRHGVRGDRERADLADVSRDLLPKARALLVECGIVTFEEVSRGRAMLWRAAAVLDTAGKPIGSHGRPLGVANRQRIAEAAAKRRTTRPHKPVESRPQDPAVPIRLPAGASPMQAPPAPAAAAADGAAARPPRDGEQQMPQNLQALAIAAQEGHGMLDVLLHHKAHPEDYVATTPEDREQRTRQQAERLLADGPRLQRAVDECDVVDLLEGFGVFDRCDRVPRHKAGDLLDRRRQGLAWNLERAALSPKRAATIVVQIGAAVLRDRKARRLGAVVAHRLARFVADQDLAAVAGPWVDLDARAIAAVFAGRRAAPTAHGERRVRSAPAPRDYTEHPAVRRMRSRLIGAAQAGDWRTLSRELSSSAAREQNIDAPAVANWSGVPESEIVAGIGAMPARRATA